MGSPRFRRRRTVVAYWRGPEFVCHEYVSHVSVACSPLTALVLHHLTDWGTAEQLQVRLERFTLATVNASLDQLEQFHLIERDVGGAQADSDASAGWGAWAPAAAFFHFATRHEFASLGDIEAAEGQIAARQAMLTPEPSRPPAAATGTVLVLPPAACDVRLQDAVLGRRTWRRFGADPVPLPHVATLLGWTWGVQGVAEKPDGRRTLRKTSPSAGACHPFEAYVLVRHVDGLEPGFYWYDAARHAVVALAGRGTAAISRYVPKQWWYDAAGLVVVMVAVFPRVQARYAFPRAYRAVLLEAGHFAQTFCLVATALELAPFSTQAFNDRALERDLGLDGIDCAPIYACGVGTRPDGEYRAWPEHKPGRPYRPPRSRRR